MTTIIYGQENCGYCTKAKALLDNEKIPYTYYDIHKDGIDLVELTTKTAPGAKTVPIVISNGIWIGGFTELKAHLENWKNIVKQLRALLAKGETVYVQFIKSDGTIRDMMCTTNPDKIPDIARPVTEGSAIRTNPIDPNLFTVYDTVKCVWRSFKADRLLKIS